VVKAPSYEIIGLVKNLGTGNAAQSGQGAGVYLPAVPGSQGALNLIVHSRGDPLALAPRIRALATAVDPALRIEQITRLDEVVNPLLWFLGLWMKIVLGLTAVALLLSLAGIYSVLSYIVARRTREIGVRVALGATGWRVIRAIFKRPVIQFTLGVIAGCGLIALAAIGIQNTTQFEGTETGGMGPTELAMLIGYAIVMLGVCTLACVVPTLRALRVQPTQAMRAE
jgi:ABC-type antimicrobial peptide transport system permease subunit